MSSTLHRENFCQDSNASSHVSKICHKSDFDGILEQHINPMQAWRHWERERLLNILTPGTLSARMELLQVASVEAGTDSARNGFPFEDEQCHSFGSRSLVLIIKKHSSALMILP